MSYRQESERFHELDALRGVAAIVVVLTHFHDLIFDRVTRNAFPRVKLGLLYMAAPFYSGKTAVILFFVLSGFVLSLPYLAGKQQPYPIYALRRIARIYLPYLAALGIAVIGNIVFCGRLVPGTWTVAPWSQPPHATLVWQHILFLGSYDVVAFNTVFWTLVIEMRFSLALPLILFAMGRMRLRTGILVTAVLAILVTALSLHFSDTDLLRTLLYTPCFLAGNLLARGRHEVHGWYSSLTLLGRLIFIGMSFLFCGYAIALRASPPITNFICLLGAIGAIIVTLNESVWRDFLRKRLQQFLGQTSYSIYLVHIPVLFSCYVLLGHRMSHTLLFICYLGCVLLFSTAFYYVVEYPSLRLSRFIGTSLHHKQQ